MKDNRKTAIAIIGVISVLTLVFTTYDKEHDCSNHPTTEIYNK